MLKMVPAELKDGELITVEVTVGDKTTDKTTDNSYQAKEIGEDGKSVKAEMTLKLKEDQKVEENNQISQVNLISSYQSLITYHFSRKNLFVNSQFTRLASSKEPANSTLPLSSKPWSPQLQ